MLFCTTFKAVFRDFSVFSAYLECMLLLFYSPCVLFGMINIGKYKIHTQTPLLPFSAPVGAPMTRLDTGHLIHITVIHWGRDICIRSYIFSYTIFYSLAIFRVGDEKWSNVCIETETIYDFHSFLSLDACFTSHFYFGRR